MKKLATLIVAILTCSCASNTPPPSENLRRLHEVQRLSMPTVSGQQRSISDFHGKIIMLHFFSSWCPDCNMEAPTLRNLQTNFSGQGFSIVGVAIDDDPFNIQAFSSKYQLQFPILIDNQRELCQFFGIKELPVTLFLDRNGVPINFKDPLSGETTAKIIGARQWDTSKPVQMVAALVENR